MIHVDRVHLWASHQLLLCSNSPHFDNIMGKLTQFYQNCGIFNDTDICACGVTFCMCSHL